MTPIRRLFTPALGVILLAMMLGSACSGLKNQYNDKKLFRLSAAPKAARPMATDRGQGLVVSNFQIAPEFTDAAFIYRTGENKFAADYFHQFMIPPARMIREVVTEALYASPLFSPVSPGSGIVFLIRGKIIDLYGDLREDTAPMAVVTLRLALDRQTDSGIEPVTGKTYYMRIPMAETGPDAYAAGLNQGLTRILDAFFRDLGDAGLTH